MSELNRTETGSNDHSGPNPTSKTSTTSSEPGPVIVVLPVTQAALSPDLESLSVTGSTMADPQTAESLQVKQLFMRAHDIYSAGSDGGSLNTRCHRTLRSVGPIPEYELGYLLKNVFPLRSADMVLPTITDMFNADLLDENGRWKLFQQSPSESGLGENEYFSNLPTVVAGVINLVEFLAQGRGKPNTKKNPICEFKSEPNKTPLSERGNTSRPDFFLILKKLQSVDTPSSRNSWEDIVCAGEGKLKLDKASAYDNMIKIIWSCTYILRNDFSRRFTYGITIEDKQMRLWVFSRGGIMVSKPLKWLEDWENFIKVFASLAYADLEQLVFSPVIKPILYEGGPALEITIDGLAYVTTGQILSEYRARRCIGRGTRVITVRLLNDPNGPELAFKFYWMPKGSIHEGELLTTVRNEAKSKNIEADLFLLTCTKYGIMKWKREGDLKETKDTTDLLVRKGCRPLCFYGPSDPVTAEKDADSLGGIGEVPGPQTGDEVVDENMSDRLNPYSPLSYEFRHKQHVFLFFKEIGITLHDISTAGNLLCALREGVKAIYYLHQTGFVHRDVSTGNFLMYMGTTRLMDLEYIKPIKPLMPEPANEELKTGTAQFMSHEVQHGAYLHRAKIVVNESNMSLEDRVNLRLLEAFKNHTPMDFRYNTAHDFESCYWIFLWSLFFHVPVDCVDHDIDTQLSIGLLLFPTANTGVTLERFEALVDAVKLNSYLECLPALLGKASKTVQKIAQTCVVAHEDLQKQFPKVTCLSGLFYKYFVDLLEALIHEFPFSSVKIMFVKESMRERKRVSPDEDKHAPPYNGVSLEIKDLDVVDPAE